MGDHIVNKRRTYLTRLVSGMSGLALMGIYIFRKKKPKRSLKMLTEDGRLVEVDSRITSKKGRKISTQEIHHWIKK